jgi:hypothetical protein
LRLRQQNWDVVAWNRAADAVFGYGGVPADERNILRRISGARVIAMEYSSFTVDGRPDLGIIVYNPAGADDVDKVQRLMAC